MIDVRWFIILVGIPGSFSAGVFIGIILEALWSEFHG